MNLKALLLLWDQPTKVSFSLIFLLILAEIVFFKKRRKSLKSSLVVILSTLLICLLVVGLGRFWLSQRHFLAAQDFAKKNLGQETIQELKKAVYFNPLNDMYHLSLAQASLALANQEAKRENPNQERVEKMVKEAIEEGKKATLIAPEKVQNWLGLGNIYRFLGAIAGAKDWAIKCYKKALELDPNNAQIHQLLASVYFSQGKIEETKAELETALSLVEENSPNFQRIKKELERLK